MKDARELCSVESTTRMCLDVGSKISRDILYDKAHSLIVEVEAAQLIYDPCMWHKAIKKPALHTVKKAIFSRNVISISRVIAL